MRVSAPGTAELASIAQVFAFDAVPGTGARAPAKNSLTS
jgi:hypothetical protein